MILIITNKFDDSTNSVMDWISFFGFQFKRIDSDQLWINNLSMSALICNQEENSVKKNSKVLSEIDSVWFRKNISQPFIDQLSAYATNGNKAIDSTLLLHLLNEYSFGKRGIYSCIKQNSKRVLGSISYMSKIETLNIAKALGIEVPNTLITTSKNELQMFFDKYRQIITKPIVDTAIYTKQIDDKLFSFLSYTEEIDREIIANLPDQFFPSLFQEKLQKDFEIRSFYLNKRFYTMAIFSQNDEQTMVDFRKYNRNNNNRNVPYQLSHSLEKKIVKLMQALGLNTGSLDIVKTKDGRLVFLEVNPTGQYAMTSNPCNYHLDRKIANFLAYGQ